MPPNRRRVISSRGAALSGAFTNTWTGFCFVRCSMISNARRTTRYAFDFFPVKSSVRIMPLMSRSTMLAFAFPNGLFPPRPPRAAPRRPRVFAGFRAASLGGGAGVSSGDPLSSNIASPDGLLLPPLHELLEGDVVDLDHLVPHAGDVAVRAAHPSADSFDEDLVVLVNEIDRAIAGRERRDLAAVLDELNLHALPQRGVRLFRLDRDLLEDDSPTLGSAFERVRLLLEMEDAALVVPVGPAVLLAVLDQFPCSFETSAHGSPSSGRNLS